MGVTNKASRFWSFGVIEMSQALFMDVPNVFTHRSCLSVYCLERRDTEITLREVFEMILLCLMPLPLSSLVHRLAVLAPRILHGCYLRTRCRNRDEICVSHWQVMLITVWVTTATSLLHLLSPSSRSELDCGCSKGRLVKWTPQKEKGRGKEEMWLLPVACE